MSKWTDIKKKKWEESLAGQPVCQFCRQAGATEFHHGVFPKGQTNFKKYRKWLDHECNGIELCSRCHDNLPDNARKISFAINSARYGQRFLDWYDSIPMVIKEDYGYGWTE